MEDKTQKQLALEIVCYEMNIPQIDVIKELEHQLDKAQNKPPSGESDGSIDEDLYNLLRTIENKALDLAAFVAVAKQNYMKE